MLSDSLDIQSQKVLAHTVDQGDMSPVGGTAADGLKDGGEETDYEKARSAIEEGGSNYKDETRPGASAQASSSLGDAVIEGCACCGQALRHD